MSSSSTRSKRLATPAVLLPDDLRKQLIANGKAGHAGDCIPVVKFIDPGGPATWLLTEIRREDPDVVYGLIHDARMERSPTLGYASLVDLGARHSRSHDAIQRDLHFVARYPLSVYVTAARLVGTVSDDVELLYLIATALGVKPTSARASPTAIAGGKRRRKAR